MGDLLGSFPESVQVRTKHAEKARVGLWGQSVILKAVWGVTQSFEQLINNIRVQRTKKYNLNNKTILRILKKKTKVQLLTSQ
jgi:hypothetical protein